MISLDVAALSEIRKTCETDGCRYKCRIRSVSADGKWTTWACGNPTPHIVTACEPGTRRCDAEATR